MKHLSDHGRLVRLCAIAIFGALAFVLTAFCAIPYGAGGYFNFGDVISLFVAMSFGPLEGALVGIIGGTLGDVFAGYAVYAPFTALAKGLMGLVTGFLWMKLKKHKVIRFVSPYLGSVFMVAIYMIAYAIIIQEGVILSSAFDAVQALVSSSLAIPLYLLLEKTGLIKRIEAETN
jgi:uncharacterized membrane protein